MVSTQHFSDFGALLTGGGGGGNGEDSKVEGQFADPEFATIFAVSWFLIICIILFSVIFVVVAYKVRKTNDVIER